MSNTFMGIGDTAGSITDKNKSLISYCLFSVGGER